MVIYYFKEQILAYIIILQADKYLKISITQFGKKIEECTYILHISLATTIEPHS